MTAPMMTLADLAVKGPDVDVPSSPTTAPSRGWSAPCCWSRATNGPCSADTCSLRACRPSAILPRLGCLLCKAEHRVHLSPSALSTYTTRWVTIGNRRMRDFQQQYALGDEFL